MDKSLKYIEELFDIKNLEPEQLSPLMLAYVGDAVYELIIRTALLRHGNASTKTVNRRAIKYVKAPAQAAMIEILLPSLTEAEADVYRRGRNANSATKAKNASIIDYRKATGYEALMGYLYLKGESERLIELVCEGINQYNKMD